MDKQGNNSPAQKKLISFLKRRDPNLSEKDLLNILIGVKRFVNLTRKIYTEPQARVTYRDRIVKNKVYKDRIFNTNIKELRKLMTKPAESLRDVLRKFHKSVTKDRHE